MSLKKIIISLGLQTLMNLNHMMLLVSVIQIDEGVQSSLPNEQKSTTPSLPLRGEGGRHVNYEQQLIESQ